MSTEKNYTVTVSFPPEVSAKARNRAGIEVARVGGYHGPLTADQLREIKADPLLTVVEGDGEGVDLKATQAEADQIKADAQAEADQIIASAKEEADKIKAEAAAKGEEAISAANDQATKIVEDAKAKAAESAKPAESTDAAKTK